MASREPVEAPEGTAARPMVPDSSSTSHSTVGLPRESRISRPTMSTIALMQVSLWSLEFLWGGSDAFDQRHAHDGDVFAGLDRGLVFGRVVEGTGLLHRRKLQEHHAVGRPVAFEHFGL